MIRVTRINDAELVVNADLIEFVESIPESMITLTTGKKIMVKETVDEIIERVADFKRMTVPRITTPGADTVSDGR